MKFKDSLGGEVKVKYKQPYGAGGVVTVPLKPTSISALCGKNLTSGLRGLSVWCTNSVKKKTTEPTKGAWKPKFCQDDLTFTSMSAALYLWMCGSSLFVELHQEGSAPAACTVGLFSLYIEKKLMWHFFYHKSKKILSE